MPHIAEWIGAGIIEDQERLIQAYEERDAEVASALIASVSRRTLRAVEEQLRQDQPTSAATRGAPRASAAKRRAAARDESSE